MRRLITLLLAGLLLFTLFTGSVTLAQDIPVLYCGDLSEADCQLLNNALTSLPNLHSAQIDLTAHIWQGDTPPVEYMRLSGFLNGAVSLNMFQSPAGYYEFLRDLDAELTVTALRSLEDDSNEQVSVSFMLLDKVFYIDLAGLQPLLNDPALPAWGCYDLSADLDAKIDDMRAREAESEVIEPFANGFDPNVLVEVLGADFTRQFIQVTRTDEDDSAWFETRVDLAGLYADPTFREALRERMLNQKEPRSFTEITDAQLDRLQVVVADLFPEPVVILRFGVDQETGFLSSVYSWRPDEWYITITGGLFGQGRDRASHSAFAYTLNLSDLNAARIITAPDGAEPFAVNDLRGVEVVWAVLPLSSIVRESSGSCYR